MTGAEATIASVHIEQGIEARRWERFIIQRSGILMAVSPLLAGLTTRNCRVVDISRGGACINVMTTTGLPDHYYLSFSGLAQRIGCAEVYRNNERLGLRFIKPLPEGMLSGIMRGDFLSGDGVPAKR